MLRRTALRGSVWGSMATTPAAEPAPRRWQPPPRPAGDEEGTAAAAAADTGEIAVPLDVAMALDKPPRGDVMEARRADLPWPHTPTAKSFQIAKVDGELGIEFWGPSRDEEQKAREESIVQTDFTFEEDVNPVLALTANGNHAPVRYDNSYSFYKEQREVKREIEGFIDSLDPTSTRHRLPTTNEVTFRTRERVLPGSGLAYFEVENLSNCLHFGIGVAPPEAFDPFHWVGYTKGTYAWYEDGRMGTVGDHASGAVMKPYDDVGLVVYTPPDLDHAYMFCVKNNAAAGDPIKLPKSKLGWYFSVTMIGYHYGGVHARITYPPKHLESSLRHLGRKLYPEDDDFHQMENKEVYGQRVIQSRCSNRWNPYHVCSDACREASVTLRADDDMFGKPMLSDEVPIRPSWQRHAHASQNFTPSRRGAWTHRADHRGDRAFRAVHHNWMKTNQEKQKYGRVKAPTWQHGNMKYS